MLMMSYPLIDFILGEETYPVAFLSIASGSDTGDGTRDSHGKQVAHWVVTRVRGVIALHFGELAVFPHLLSLQLYECIIAISINKDVQIVHANEEKNIIRTDQNEF